MTGKFVSDAHRAAILQELHLGPNQMGSVFADREELEQAWREYRPELMAMMQPGRRPLAWWKFDCPAGLKFDVDHEASILWRAGVLDAEERREVEEEWRREFEKAFTLPFDAAWRKERFDWADIPRELVKAWLAERKRNAKTIRNLKTETVLDSTSTQDAPAAMEELRRR